MHTRSHLRVLFAGLLGAMTWASCTLEPSQGQFACESEADCPSGWLCHTGFCYSDTEHFPTDTHPTTDGTQSDTVSESHSQTQTTSDTTDSGTFTESETQTAKATDSDSDTVSQTETDSLTATGSDTVTGTVSDTVSETVSDTVTDTDAFAPEGWTDCRHVRLTNNTSTTLTGFPVPVRLSAAHGPIYDLAAIDGRDLLFLASDKTTVLPHEIEMWTKDGNSVIWVRVPTIAASSNNTFFYMCYGNAEATDSQNAPAVWTAYAGVWHLAELSGTVAVDSLAASPGEYLGSVEFGVSGAMGDYAAVFGSGRAIDLGAFPLGGSAMTVEAVISIASCPSDTPGRIFARADEGAADTDHEVYMQVIRANPTKCDIGAGIRSDSASAYDTADQSLSKNQWVHAVLVFGNSAMKIYVSGVERASVPLAGALRDSPTAKASWGASLLPDITWPFDGKVSEVRISHSELSPGWIAAQHAAMLTAGFVTIE